MLEFKTDPAGTVTGYASLFGRPADAVKDVVQPGAYAVTLAAHKAAGTMPALLLEHKGATVGTWTTAEEDALGLKVEGQLDLTTAAGRAAHEAVKSGRVDGLSIGFRAVKSDRASDGARLLAEVALAEISLVKRPASSRSRILAVKSFPPTAGAVITTEDTMENEIETAPDGDEVKNVDVAAVVAAAVKPIADRLGKLEIITRRPGVATETKTDDNSEKKAFENYLRYGRERMDSNEVKSLNLSNDTNGGYLAVPEFVAEIDKNVVLFSPIRQYATVRNTASGEVNVPRRIGRPSATWVGELEDRDSTETETTYGMTNYPVSEITAFIDVSLSMLEDAAVNVFAELAADLGEEFGAAEGTAFVVGNGIKKPAGFMLDTNVGFTASGSATAITADGLIDLYHGIPAPYRTNAIWGMNSATLGAVRKLKDGEGDYLLTLTGLAGAPAATILGRPVIELPDMADVAAGAFPVVFGDFAQAYRVYDRIGFSILRDDFTQRTKGKVRFHARKRVAGGVKKSEAIRRLKVSV